MDAVTGGTCLWTPAAVDLARAEESAGPDRTLVVNTRFGLGCMLHGTASPFLGLTSFGHPGRGRPLGFANPESGTDRHAPPTATRRGPASTD